jgi:hypothetical protein
MLEQSTRVHASRRFGPGVDTEFHIDHDWWANSSLDYRFHLYQQLCDECRQRFRTHVDTEEVDWVDAETGEVRRVDALKECLRISCTHQPDFIDDTLPLTAACFRVFLSNDNSPLSPTELSGIFEQSGASRRSQWTPQEILRILNGKQVFLGIRPAPAAP